MTRDEIIRLYEKANGWSPAAWPNTVDDLTRFAALVAAAEREACAKVCEEECSDPYEDFKNYEDTHTDGWMDGCNSCAAAIRARGETK